MLMDTRVKKMMSLYIMITRVIYSGEVFDSLRFFNVKTIEKNEELNMKFYN